MCWGKLNFNRRGRGGHRGNYEFQVLNFELKAWASLIQNSKLKIHNLFHPLRLIIILPIVEHIEKEARLVLKLGSSQ
jgi:hypothetical protein